MSYLGFCLVQGAWLEGFKQWEGSGSELCGVQVLHCLQPNLKRRSQRNTIEDQLELLPRTS
jgi:hypothetical protein